MRILVHCDGGGSIGVGHVMRCLALAEEAVAAGHQVVVAGQFQGSFLAGQLAAASVEVAPMAATVAATAAGADPGHLMDLVARFRPAVLHVDSYEASVRLGELVDDLFERDLILSNTEDGSYGRRPADVVVDPTVGAQCLPRPDDGSTSLLLGSRYCPVRRQVVDARLRVEGEEIGRAGHSPEFGSGQVARSVLVVMGGTDPVGLAPAAVGLLAETGLALEVTVIAVGEIAEQARAAAASSDRLNLRVQAPVDDLAALMSAQDLVVSAAGTSVWELCCIGVPMALIWAVENQRAGYDAVVAAGAAVGLGGPERAREQGGAGLLRTALTDSRLRAEMVLAGRQVVDGLGAWRVVRTWEQAVAQAKRQSMGPRGRTGPPADRTGPPADRTGSLLDRTAGLVARPASTLDARLLWDWRNDPVTRARSRSSAEVPWEDHLRWLSASLDRTDRVLLVVEDGEPVGTVRWDIERERPGEREWQVSVTVAPQRRGQSLAAPILRAGEVALTEATRAWVPGQRATRSSDGEVTTRSSGGDVTAYLAVVHIDNQASRRLFEKSGYLPDLPPDPRGFMQFRKTARVT